MEVHEAFVPTDHEQRFATRILAKAKEFAETGTFEPMGFVIADDVHESFATIPFSIFDAADWNNPDDRDRIVYCLRKLVQAVKPLCFSFVSDAWMTTIQDLAGVDAAGLDPTRHKEWSKETKKKYGVVRREAIFVSVETKQRQFLLTQFYQRDFKGRPIWEETKLSDELGHGRFVGILRGD